MRRSRLNTLQSRYATLRRRRAWRGALLICALGVCMASSAIPRSTLAQISQEPGNPAPANLDDELLRDLNSDLGDDDLKPVAPPKPAEPRQPSAGATEKPANAPAEKPALDDLLNEELLRELGSDLEEDDADSPLGKVGRAMRRVEQLVSQTRSDEPTQDLQNQIVKDLDQLLQAARQRQQQKSKSSSGNQQASREPAGKQPGTGGQPGGASNQPAQESNDSLQNRTATRPDPAAMRDLLRDLWGHLPEHERQMVINSTIERFLPKYELMIEAYFQRLAEEAAQK